MQEYGVKKFGVVRKAKNCNKIFWVSIAKDGFIILQTNWCSVHIVKPKKVALPYKIIFIHTLSNMS